MHRAPFIFRLVCLFICPCIHSATCHQAFKLSPAFKTYSNSTYCRKPSWPISVHLRSWNAFCFSCVIFVSIPFWTQNSCFKRILSLKPQAQHFINSRCSVNKSWMNDGWVRGLDQALFFFYILWTEQGRECSKSTSDWVIEVGGVREAIGK
jgi:hypothetical protein